MNEYSAILFVSAGNGRYFYYWRNVPRNEGEGGWKDRVSLAHSAIWDFKTKLLIHWAFTNRTDIVGIHPMQGLSQDDLNLAVARLPQSEDITEWVKQEVQQFLHQNERFAGYLNDEAW